MYPSLPMKELGWKLMRMRFRQKILTPEKDIELT